MLNKRFGNTASLFILLGLVLVTTGVWYLAYRANVIADAWGEHNDLVSSYEKF